MKNISQKERTGWIIGTIISALLIIASLKHIVYLDITEVLGFITGAAAVWLTAKENVWNWPIGIANAAFFTILFWNAKLFADMGLQIVYIILGFLGWYWWLKGGENKTELKVSKTTKNEWVVLLSIGLVCTYIMTLYLRSVSDSAPFLDALTTVMSLIAQYMLTKKLIENWYIWISADVIYIGLYFYKNLYLTGILYFIFMLMCVGGLRHWKKSLKAKQESLLHPEAVA